MLYEMDSAATARLEKYFGGISALLKDRRKRESFAMYAFGILGDGERKSAEPIAARACTKPERARNVHDKLLHFLGGAKWSDEAVRLEAARYAIGALSEREDVGTWIVDDTGFLKQGRHSVGVQRQYTGSAGKITNCQIGVSLGVATSREHLPIDFALYLPEDWANDPARRTKARIPPDVQFRTKIDLALDMIEKAVCAELPGEIVLADSAYGESSAFRETVRALGLDYGVGVHSTTKVRRVGSNGRLGLPFSAAELGLRIPKKKFRKITWREGSKKSLASRFHLCRVKTVHNDGMPIENREAVWLIIEWPYDDLAPSKFMLTTLRDTMSKKGLVRHIKERWRTERMYEDMKGELGLDHFEGRSFRGWHHHVSVVICCYAFVVAERAKIFPPSPGRKSRDRSLGLAA